jgi:hypothetical protein
MLIAGVAAFCVLLLIVAFLVPRLSHAPERGGKKVAGKGAQGAHKAGPGKVGEWLAKPFHTAAKMIGKSGRGGRKARDKAPF